MASVKTLSLISGVLQQDAENRKEAARHAREEAKFYRDIEKLMAVERFKTDQVNYDRSRAIVDDLSSSANSQTFARKYLASLNLSEEEISRSLKNPKLMEWVENQETRDQIINYYKGYRKPELRMQRDPDEDDKYVRQRTADSSFLTQLYRKATGQPLRKLPPMMDKTKAAQRYNEMFPEETRPTLSEQLKKTGLSPMPELDVVEKGDELRSPLTYYNPKTRQAVTAFTKQEAIKYEQEGYSAAPVASAGTRNPITLFGTKGDTVTLRADDPRIDAAIDAGLNLKIH
jgi:hypothetical protein